MLKLLNTNDFYSLEELENNMKYFQEKYNFDGFEIIKFTDKNVEKLKEKIKGYHLRFFPSWLDLYRENFEKLYKELRKEEYIKGLCGGLDKKEIVNYYRKELEIAKSLEVEYVVFHPCNVYINESFSYKFEYSNKEVLESVVKLLNEVFEGGEYNFTLLLENLWWPGLRLDSYEDAKYLMENIKYKNKGFLLDTGHMFNNNIELKNSSEGVDYILENLKKLREYKDYIYGMHLNISISGEYVKNKIQNYDPNRDFDEVMEEVYSHIQTIDSHQPFSDKRILEVINSLPLRYLTYEFIEYELPKISKNIEIQDLIFKA